MPAILLFPFGLIFGSFATAVAHRLPRGESVVTGRSRCPGCDETIAAYDNVPLLSWIALRGHCRHCGESISARYPVTELAMAALFTLTAVVLGTDDLGELALGLSLCAVLVTVTLTDLERRVIPNAVVLTGAVIAVGLAAATDPSSLAARAIASAAAGGFLLAAAVAYPRGMGMGDVKLAAMMGLFLGRAVAPALLVAIAAGAVVGIGLMLRDGPGARKTAVPFGPFLALGGVVGLLWGDQIVDWYLDTFVGG
jgi:leader peptidase (prepilin peptidase)/N-methyltransferase